MKIRKSLAQIGLYGLVLYTAASELLRPAVDPATPTSGPNRFVLIAKTAAWTAIAGLALLFGGALLFISSGVYNLAAATPHTPPVEWSLQLLKIRAVQLHSRGISVPRLTGGSLLKDGFSLYRKNCQPCHGAPGVPAEQIGRGINPKPPTLVTASADWSDPELYWIVSEGLKMSGMPAFAPRLSDRDRWAIVAFLRRLDLFSPTEYQTLSTAVDQGVNPTAWGEDDHTGFAQIRKGDPERGRQLVTEYGCVTCHTIPGTGSGVVGPPLTRFAERQYIGGIIVNLPTNAINWITDPKKYKPNTAMPNVGVKPQDALNIVAYLFTLGSSKRINALQHTP